MESQRRRGRPRKDKTGNAPAGPPVLALDRGLRTLAFLADQRGAALSEVAETMGMPIATAHRTLATLRHRGMVEYSDSHGKWFVGAQTYRIGNAYIDRSNIIEVARPIVAALAEQTGETANLAIEEDFGLIYLLQVESPNPIRASFKSGEIAYLHSSGIGKAIMAHMTEPQLSRIFERSLPAFTAKTITEPDALRAELDRIRDGGWAIDDEERSIGMRCVAAPIQSPIGDVVAGVSVSGPTTRFSEEQVASFAAAVKEAAMKISRGL